VDRPFDPETLREVFIYLYRCWLQQHLGELPVELAVSASDGVLLSSSFSLFYSVAPIPEEVAADLASRLKPPLHVFAPSFPRQLSGVTSFATDDELGHPLAAILRVISTHWKWLQRHQERALSRNEAYQLEDYGTFALWRGKGATRLLLDPQSGDRYGYAVVKNAPRDYFFRRSKSCREEGARIATGSYKKANHRQEARTSVSFDLIMESGELLLLHLVNVGGGYKAFPRQAPGPEFDGL
jgi:hypothetical protein